MIPNIIHYVWIDKSDKEYGMLPYVYELCIASCILENSKDFRIIMHSNKPMRYRFNRIEESIESDILDKATFEELRELGIDKVAHMSDYIRYSILNNVGGIYLDTDILVMKNLKYLIDNNYEFIMAKQTRDTYCCGFIASSKDNDLIKDTIEKYHTDYRHAKWDYNSMRVITNNIKNYSKDNILKLDVKCGFHYPLYTNLDDMYEEYPDGFENSYGHHLWSSSPNGKKLIKYIEENIDSIYSNSEAYIIRLCRDILERIKNYGQA